MAYLDLRAQLVSILTGTTVPANALGWPTKMVEAESVDEEGRVSRALAFEVLAPEVSIYAAISGRRMHSAQFQVPIHLGHLPTSRKNFDLALQALRVAVSNRVIDPSNWSASTTGFIVIQPSGAETSLPFSLDANDPEDVQDVLRFGVAFRS
jgi:hypothetical protein